MKLKTRYLKDYFLKSRIKSIFFWILAVVIVLIMSYVFSYYFCQNVVVQESSMEPTLSAGDRLLIDSLVYKWSSPKRGNLVAFSTSDEEGASLHVKRVIGLPGEKIQIIDGQIYINGEPYLEEADFPSISNAGLASEQISLGKDEYFLLGDNRNSSEDSRYLNVGNVKEGHIVGKIWLILTPFSRFGFVKS